jgi:hypothetical protein
MMTTTNVFQSGQAVTIAGVYEVVGVSPQSIENIRKTTTGHLEMPIREMAVGEVFPNYEGRAVMWHLKEESAAAKQQ